MFHGRRTSKMQIVVHRQSLEDNLNRYARYAHDLCKICAKDPPHCCRWSPFVQMGVEISSCIAQLGTSPLYRCIESCIAQLGNSPLSRGNGANPGIDPGVSASWPSVYCSCNRAALRWEAVQSQTIQCNANQPDVFTLTMQRACVLVK